MQNLHHLNTLVHIGAGIAALVLGLFPLLSRKGGRLHRVTGLLFAICGFAVIACAVIGVVFYPQPGPLVMVTLSAGYQYVSGLRALPRFGGAAPSAFDAALAVAALGGSALLLTRLHDGNAAWPPAIGYSTLGFVATVALYDLSRHLWVQTWRAHIRFIDHGLKMTGTLFAFASAGLGNSAPSWQPWSQLAPSMIGLAVMGLLLVLYIRDNRRKARER